MSKILIIEDNEFIRNAYVMRLKKSSYKFEVATNGQEGMEKMRDFKPDVVVLDLKMPLMDGFEVLQEIQKDQNLKKIPLIVASSVGHNKLIDKAMALGAWGYIYKEETTLKDILTILDDFIKESGRKKKQLKSK